MSTNGTSGADGEDSLQVMLRVDLKRNERLRVRDALKPRDVARHDLGEILARPEVHDRNKVPVSGDRIHLTNAIHIGEPLAGILDPVPVRLDENDGLHS